jgi:hypothetical protein
MMDKEKYKILANSDERDILQEFHQMSENTKADFFKTAISRADTEIVLKLMDEGMTIGESELNLEVPARKKNCFRFFKALHERGVNLRQRGDIIFFNACVRDGTPSLDTIMFLGNLVTEEDSRGVYLSFMNVMTQNLTNKNNDGQLSKHCEAIMEYTATKLSVDTIKQCAESLSKYSQSCPKNASFLQKKALYLALNKTLDQSTEEQNKAEMQQTSKMKI